MVLLQITNTIAIPESEIEITAIRSQGAGGQNINKVATAIHLRFSIIESSLPNAIKERLLALKSQRINKEGVLVLKIQKYRTQERNKTEALNELIRIIKNATTIPKKRKPTKPTLAAKKKRILNKKHRSKTKSFRSVIADE